MLPARISPAGRPTLGAARPLSSDPILPARSREVAKVVCRARSAESWSFPRGFKERCRPDRAHRRGDQLPPRGGSHPRGAVPVTRPGEQAGPTDELVYIILARKTRGEHLPADLRRPQARLPPMGRPARGAPRRGRNARSLGRSFREEDHEPVRGTRQAPRDIRELLARTGPRLARPGAGGVPLFSLPEIQRKSAYCIMMYSFGRKFFPADTHVGRVLTRLGPYRELGLSLAGAGSQEAPGVLAELVPPNFATRFT